MSARRSSSERPPGVVTWACHATSPVASANAMTRPESKPASTVSPASAGAALPRSDRRGTGSSPVHCVLPSAASRACRRPSTERTTTRPPATSGAASTSLPTLTSHRRLPEAGSSAMTRPSLAPTATRPAPTPGPAASSVLVSVDQRALPEAGSSETTLPSRDAANSAPPSYASPSARRSFSPPPPTLVSHSFSTASVGFRSISSAGGSTFLFLSQPASSSNPAAQAMASDRPVRIMAASRQPVSGPVSGPGPVRRPRPAGRRA